MHSIYSHTPRLVLLRILCSPTLHCSLYSSVCTPSGAALFCTLFYPALTLSPFCSLLVYKSAVLTMICSVPHSLELIFVVFQLFHTSPRKMLGLAEAKHSGVEGALQFRFRDTDTFFNEPQLMTVPCIPETSRTVVAEGMHRSSFFPFFKFYHAALLSAAYKIISINCSSVRARVCVWGGGGLRACVCMRACMHECVCDFNAQSTLTIDRQKLSNCPTKYHIAPQSTCLPKASELSLIHI